MKAIVSLAINPTIDKSSSVEFVVPGRKLRCAAPTIEPGGGGVNVSRAVRKLGGESTLLYAAGGLNGDLLQELLAGEGLLSRRLPLAGMTRESFAVLEESTGQQYRFGMPGPMLKEEEVQLALETFTPPPPGSMVGALQRSFLSGTTNSTLELLSIVGLMAKETIPFMMIPPINVARVI